MHLQVAFKDGSASLIPVTSHTEVRLVEAGQIVESFAIDGVSGISLEAGSVQPTAKVETPAVEAEVAGVNEAEHGPTEAAPAAEAEAEAGEEPVTAEQLEQDLTREELDALATEVGVESPGDLPNKAAVAEAIVAKKAETT